MFSRWKMKKCLSGTQDFFFFFFSFFAQSWAGSHSYSFQKEQKRTAFRPLSYKKKIEQNKQTNKKTPNTCPALSTFLTKRKKVQHSLDSDVTTRRRGIHFETLVLCTFYIHLCIRLTKLNCVATSCVKVLFRKIWQTTQNKTERSETQQQKWAKWSQYATLPKRTASGQ